MLQKRLSIPNNMYKRLQVNAMHVRLKFLQRRKVAIKGDSVRIARKRRSRSAQPPISTAEMPGGSRVENVSVESSRKVSPPEGDRLSFDRFRGLEGTKQLSLRLGGALGRRRKGKWLEGLGEPIQFMELGNSLLEMQHTNLKDGSLIYDDEFSSRYLEVRSVFLPLIWLTQFL